jgi:TetR/AcrR family transcriptional repressor of nem operon
MVSIKMEDSRKLIVQTAFKLFMEKSFKAVTFQELRDKTGFSQGAFFYFFKNKQEIYEAVIDMYLDHFATVDYTRIPQDSLRNFLDGYIPGAQKMRAEFFTEEIAKEATGYSLIFEALRIIPHIKTKLNKHEEKALAAWKQVIATAKKNKEIKSVIPDEQIAKLFIDAGHGIALSHITHKDSKSFPKEVLTSWNNLYSLLKK